MHDTKKLLSNSLIVFVGTIAGSFFSYLFNMLMGRMLGPTAYGDMTTIMSATAIMLVAGGAIVTVVMMYSSELYAERNISALAKLLRIFSKYLLFAGLIFFLITLFFSSQIAVFFSISNKFYVIIGFSSVIVGLLMAVNRGFLQGVQRFIPLSMIGISETALRVILGVIAVRVGFGVGGAVMATVIATIVAYLLSFHPIKKILREKEGKHSDFNFNKGKILAFAIPTLFASLLMALSVNMDILLVKHFFDPRQAGVYAAISTIGKIILYLVAPIIGVMFPMITEKRTRGEKHYKTLALAVLVTTIASVLILAVYAIAPTTVIRILYGSKYTEFYYLLPQVGLFIIIYSLINLFCNYFIAVKDFIFIIFYTIVVVIQVFAVQFYHPSISVVVKEFILSNAVLFFLLSAYYLFTKRAQATAMIKGEYER